MSFLETVARARAHLETQGRVSLAGLAREFGLDDEALDALVEELVAVLAVARREGSVLHVVQPAAAAPPPASGGVDAAAGIAAEAERRHLTVMFVDLVGSTALSERIDPEDFAAILEGYQDRCREVLRRWGGYVARPLGDGLVIYFGFPRAQEDAASRAIRAALEITAAMPALTETMRPAFPVLGEHALAVRVGVHTGLAVVGDVASAGTPEQVAVGDTPNLAARLQGEAGPGEVIISDATLHLVPGMFRCEDRGTRALKGIAAPVRVHRVLGATGMESRLPSRAAGLAPLVGREREVEALLAHWERARAGRGQVVLISGEAGIGKSRIAQVLRDRLSADAFAWLEGHGSPYHRATAFHPVSELLRQGVGLGVEDDDPAAALARLDAVFGPLPVEGAAAAIAALLSVELPEDRAASVAPARLRARTMEAVVAWIRDLAAEHPLILLVEDLHWCDPSTLEWIDTLVSVSATTPLLLLLSFRPDFDAAAEGFDRGWENREHVHRLEVGRLPPEDAAALVAEVGGGNPLPADVVERIVERADGVPIFVEELAKMVVETGVDLLRELHIPATLQDSLMARLDRLGEAKDVAQLAATLGREFPLDLLAAVSLSGASELHRGVEALVEAGFLYRRERGRSQRLQFKHALVQEMAYQSLLRSTRCAHHRRIASVLETEFAALRDREPQLLAHHHQESGPEGYPRAVDYWRRAGHQAVARSANAEAIHHLRAGLALLETLPEGEETLRSELRFQLPLGTAFLVSRGYRAPEVGAAYGRAQEICEVLGDTRELVAAVFGQWRHTMAPPDFETGLRLGEQLVALAAGENDPASQVLAHYALGSVHHLLGDAGQTREHMERGLAYADRVALGALLPQAGIDPVVTCRSVLCHALWELGLADQATRQRDAALALAGRLGHPPSEAFAVVWTGAKLSMFRDEPAETRRYAERAIALCEEHDIALFLAMAHVLRGWARARAGDGRGGRAELDAGLGALAGQGTQLFLSAWLALRADAERSDGDLPAALASVDEGLACAERNDERFWEAELHRLRGEITVEQGGAKAPVEAEQSFSRALQIARTRGTLGFELRATRVCAAWVSARGEVARARAMLDGVLEKMTEGRDGPDARAAAALRAGL